MSDIPTISAEKLCALTGLTDRRHRQLAKEGYFPSPIKSEYQLSPTIKGMFQYFKERLTSKTNADERIKTARAEKLEIQNAALKRDLLPIEEVRRDVTRGFTELKTQLLVIPRRLAQPLAMETDAVVIEERVEKELLGVLETMANGEWIDKGEPK